MSSINRIRDYPIFASLSQAELAQIAPCVSKRSFAKGAYLYHPGNPALNIYLVESGLVRLFFANMRGQEFVLDLLGPRATVGLPLLHEDQARMAGAAALQPVTALLLSQKDLGYFAQRSPQLMSNIYRGMDVALRKLMRLTQMLITVSLTGRLALILLYLSEIDKSQGTRDEFDFPLSQGEMAGWLGASRGHLNRALKRLQGRGLIRLEGQKLAILDRPGLRQMTEDFSME
ncbi:MAG: Crp/Fnr family transcriptional regulator [Anaerolineales bacterium]|nr:Crp/Fnr family transcriptional regulator [Anaerolineales bacterium]